MTAAPPELWAGIAGIIGGAAAPWPIKALWRLIKQNGETELSREEHIAVLRVALDKAGIRQNATVSVCTLLLIALELVDELPPAAERAKHQARQKLADVVRTLERICNDD